MPCEGTVESPCVVEFSTDSIAAVAVPLILLLVVAVALLVRSLK